MAERLNRLGRNIEFLRNFGNWFEGCFASNFDITFCHFYLQIV